MPPYWGLFIYGAKMNLHAIANRAVSALHPNLRFVLIRALGSENEQGRLLGQFGQCEVVIAQTQTLSGDELRLEHELYEVDIVRKFFFSIKGRPVLAGLHLLEAGSDFLFHVGTSQFWRVFNVAEDFYLSGWAQVYGALQNKPPQGVVQALIDSGLISSAMCAALKDKFLLEVPNEEESPKPPSTNGSVDNSSGASDSEHSAEHTSDTNAPQPAAGSGSDSDQFWSY